MQKSFLMSEMARQGDVLLRRIDKIPSGAKPQARDAQGRVVLAHGEVTGHAHALHGQRVTMYMDTGGKGGTYLRVTGKEPEALSHEEHDTILIPPGDYEVGRQAEYRPEKIIRVAD